MLDHMQFEISKGSRPKSKCISQTPFDISENTQELAFFNTNMIA